MSRAFRDGSHRLDARFRPTDQDRRIASDAVGPDLGHGQAGDVVTAGGHRADVSKRGLTGLVDADDVGMVGVKDLPGHLGRRRSAYLASSSSRRATRVGKRVERDVRCAKSEERTQPDGGHGVLEWI